MKPDGIPLREELRTLADGVIRFGDLLEAVIGIRPSGGEHRRGKLDFSQPPWNATAADAVLDLHAEIRQLEASMQREAGLPVRHRGGSGANSTAAVNNLCQLAHAVCDDSVRIAVRSLSSWTRRAKIALDITEMPRRLPRTPGQPEPVCPFCRCHTLRIRPLEGLIQCIGDCTDDQGRKPVAHMEYSGHLSGWVLVWQDGIPGVPTAA